MYNAYEIQQKYESQGYEYLGSVITCERAFNAWRESKKHEAFKIGRCLELLVLHDLKAIVEYDFGD